jgi:Tol biopolymer transport system component
MAGEEGTMRRGPLVCVTLVAILAIGSAAFANPGDIVLASSSDTGEAANFESRIADISGDGGSVAFESNATNLDPLDTDLFDDIYVKDLGTGEVTLASVAPSRSNGRRGKGRGGSGSPVKGNLYSLRPSLSADGTRVAFDTGSSNLHPDDEFGDLDIYVKDLISAELILASTAADGTKGNGYSVRPSISADGTKVVFDSTATNLDPADGDTNFDVYVKDLVTGAVDLVSMTVGGVKGNEASFGAAISPDGTRVAFNSQAANLDPADPDGFTDVYVKDLITGKLLLASTSDQGATGNDASFGPKLSRDGAVVAFMSRATNLDPADAHPYEDVYVKDLETGDLNLVSTADDGTKGNGLSFLGSISADGRVVAFDSLSTNLHSADTDSFDDVFLKDVVTGALMLVSVTAEGVKGNDHSGAASLSAGAGRVAFGSSATNLHPDITGRRQILVKEL